MTETPYFMRLRSAGSSPSRRPGSQRPAASGSAVITGRFSPSATYPYLGFSVGNQTTTQLDDGIPFYALVDGRARRRPGAGSPSLEAKRARIDTLRDISAREVGELISSQRQAHAVKPQRVRPSRLARSL